jgi:hypothetical protein
MSQLDQAWKRYLETNLEFTRIAEGAPSGIPHPDGLARIRRSAAVRRRAYAEYQKMKNRLDYIAAQGDRMNP